jgi:hypothetical protein
MNMHDERWTLVITEAGEIRLRDLKMGDSQSFTGSRALHDALRALAAQRKGRGCYWHEEGGYGFVWTCRQCKAEQQKSNYGVSDDGPMDIFQAHPEQYGAKPHNADSAGGGFRTRLDDRGYSTTEPRNVDHGAEVDTEDDTVLPSSHAIHRGPDNG